MVGGGGGGGWWIKVIFMSHPTFELSWGWVGVVTIFRMHVSKAINYNYEKLKSSIFFCVQCIILIMVCMRKCNKNEWLTGHRAGLALILLPHMWSLLILLHIVKSHALGRQAQTDL